MRNEDKKPIELKYPRNPDLDLISLAWQRQSRLVRFSGDRTAALHPREN